jgi:hypothetical protein
VNLGKHITIGIEVLPERGLGLEVGIHFLSLFNVRNGVLFHVRFSQLCYLEWLDTGAFNRAKFSNQQTTAEVATDFKTTYLVRIPEVSNEQVEDRL